MIGLRVVDLCRTYRTGGQQVTALDDVAFEARPGESIAVVGYSGSGKTSLLRHVAGLARPDRGRVEFLDPEGGPSAGFVLGMVFQEPRLLPWLTVTENVALALRHARLPGEAGAAVADALDLVGLGGFTSAYPRQLSGGMAQRVAMARALVRRPDILLLDEPFGALDAFTRGRLQAELARILALRPATVLFVTHDIAEALLLADRVLVMDRGRIAASVTVAALRPRDPGAPELARLARHILDNHFNTSERSTPC